MSVGPHCGLDFFQLSKFSYLPIQTLITSVATNWLTILIVDLLQGCRCSFPHTQGQYPLQGAGLYANCVLSFYIFCALSCMCMKMTEGDAFEHGTLKTGLLDHLKIAEWLDFQHNAVSRFGHVFGKHAML